MNTGSKIWKYYAGMMEMGRWIDTMIRGVNKNVIEISDTGNDYFERAILFVRPDSAAYDSDAMRRRAGDYLAGIRLRPWFYPRGRLILRILSLLGAAAAGGTLTAFLLTL